MFDWLRIALVVIAWPGHAFALTVGLNLLYSFPLPRKLQRGGRMLVGLLVLSFPALALYDFNSVGWLPTLIRWYLYASCFMSLIMLPLLTIKRALRRPPAELIESSTKVVDLKRELNTPLLGFGKHWRLARLPGNQILEVEFSQHTLRMPRLPAAWDGLTILHISDLHFHGTPTRQFFCRALEIAMEGGVPDLVCITGDFADSVRHHAWIKPMLQKLKWREAGLAILGNHDYWSAADSVRRQVQRGGYSIPGNGWQVVQVRGEPLVVLSHEGPWFRPDPNLEDCPNGAFRLCLSHTPDNINWAVKNNVDLMLSGHVHGGQIRVPILGPLFIPSRHSRKYDSGLFREGSTLLYVVRGVSGREPLRWNCRPEIARLKLVR